MDEMWFKLLKGIHFCNFVLLMKFKTKVRKKKGLLLKPLHTLLLFLRF